MSTIPLYTLREAVTEAPDDLWGIRTVGDYASPEREMEARRWLRHMLHTFSTYDRFAAEIADWTHLDHYAALSRLNKFERTSTRVKPGEATPRTIAICYATLRALRGLAPVPFLRVGSDTGAQLARLRWVALVGFGGSFSETSRVAGFNERYLTVAIFRNKLVGERFIQGLAAQPEAEAGGATLDWLRGGEGEGPLLDAASPGLTRAEPSAPQEARP